MEKNLPFLSSFSVVENGGKFKITSEILSTFGVVVVAVVDDEIFFIVFSSSELNDDVPLLALSDLPRFGLFSGEFSLDGSASDVVFDDCCFLLRYSVIDSYVKNKIIKYLL